MYVTCFKSEDMDAYYNSSRLYKRRVNVEKKLRKELKALCARYGLEMHAESEEYGAYIKLSTIHGAARSPAHKARKEEDREILEMNQELYREYRRGEAEAAARRG